MLADRDDGVRTRCLHDLHGNDIGIADEAGGERGGRRAVDRLGGADLLDATLVQHDDAVRQGHGLALVVRDIDEGGAGLAVDAAQLRLHFEADRQVEGGERLVEEQHLRTLHQHAGEGHALHLSAGQLVTAAALVAFEPNQGQRLAHAARDLVARQALQTQPEGDVLADIEVREKRRPLEDRVERAKVGGQRRHVPTAQKHASLGRLYEAGHDAKQRGLAAARGPEQAEELAVLDRERDVGQRRSPAVAMADAIEQEAPVLAAHAGVPALASGIGISAKRRALPRSVNRKATTKISRLASISRLETVLIDGSMVRRSPDQM